MVHFTNHLPILHLAFLKCWIHLVQTHQHLLHEIQLPVVKKTILPQQVNIINLFNTISYTEYVWTGTNVSVAQSFIWAPEEDKVLNKTYFHSAENLSHIYGHAP